MAKRREKVHFFAIERGTRVIVPDESTFARVGKNGSKLWSLMGEKIEAAGLGHRDEVVAYGGIADNCTRIMRTCDEFNGANFVNCLDRVRRKYPEGAPLIMDNAARHKSGKVRKYPERNPETEVMCLPAAGPELSAIEEIWRQAKYGLITSEPREAADELRTAVSAFRDMPRQDLHLQASATQCLGRHNSQSAA